MSTNASSFVVISHVNPHTSGPEGGLSSEVPAPTPKPLVKFYRGEPESLGVTQICVGIILFTLGLAVTITIGNTRSDIMLVVHSGLLFWSSVMYLLSGSLSVAASIKPTMGMMKSSLVLNIISSVVAAVAIILMAICIPLSYANYYSAYNHYCAYYLPSEVCEGEFARMNFLQGIMTTVLILTTLVFTINISTSVFACKTLCRSSFNEMTVVIYQTTSSDFPVTTATSTTKQYMDKE